MKNSSDIKNEVLTIPNILSVLRLCMIPIIILLYCVKQDYLLTGCVLILSGITDIADGYIARRFHMTSNLGKILDPIADKLTQAAMLFCLATRFPLMLAPIVMMFFKEVFVGVTGILVIRKTGMVYSAKWHGKVATVMLYTMMILHVIWYDIPGIVSDISIHMSVSMMIISFFMYGSLNIKKLKGKLSR